MDTNFNMTPDWVTAIATIILVLATCIYVYFSYKLTKETLDFKMPYFLIKQIVLVA